MSNNAGNGNSHNNQDDDALASFTTFGADGQDVDEASLLGSFTTDAAQGHADGGNIFGQISANDLSGFGVDLSSLDVSSGGNEGGMDLSSIQLMNLNDSALGGSSVGPGSDAAQMMARLLGPGSQGPIPSAVAAQTASVPAAGIAVSGGAGLLGVPPAGMALDAGGLLGAAASTGLQNQTGKARSGSQSSDEMGDIPLAQLALLQGGAGGQQVGAGSSSGGKGAVPASLPVSMPGLMGAGALDGRQNGQLASSILGGVQLPRNDLGQSSLVPGAAVASAATTALPTSAALDATLAQAVVSEAMEPVLPVTEAGASESGFHGVQSTVLPELTADKAALESSNLQLELEQPSSNIDETPLAELELIEDRLYSLLGMASTAIQMVAGHEDSGSGQDSAESRLESTIEEFVDTVAKVQAGLCHQHQKLVARGIPIQVSAAFHTDVAGPEHDLAAWSDAADLLATALDSGLKLAAQP